MNLFIGHVMNLFIGHVMNLFIGHHGDPLRLPDDVCVPVPAGRGLQRGAAAPSPAAGSGNPRGQLEARAELPIHAAGLQPRSPAQPDGYEEEEEEELHHVMNYEDVWPLLGRKSNIEARGRSCECIQSVHSLKHW